MSGYRRISHDADSQRTLTLLQDEITMLLGSSLSTMDSTTWNDDQQGMSVSNEPSPGKYQSPNPDPYEPTPIGPQGIQFVIPKDQGTIASLSSQLPPCQPMRLELRREAPWTHASAKPAYDRSSKIKTWDQRFQDLVGFKTLKGHCNVSELNGDDPDLTQWTKRQRYHYTLLQAGKKSPLTSQQKQQLDQIGFTWSIHDEKWDDRFEDLCRFKQKHNNCNVPRTYPLNQQLSAWVKRQRQEYRQRRMSPERIARLESLGFVWDIMQHRQAQKQEAIERYRSSKSGR